MLRQLLLVNSIFVLLLFGPATVQDQTLSNCRTPPPMPLNARPGVGGLSLSRDGQTLVVAGGDGRIRFVDMTSGEVRKSFPAHTNVVYKAVFSPDEKLLASSSRDLTARIWDVATNRELHRLGGFRCSVKALAFSPNGRVLAAAGNDGMLKLWDIASGKELQSLVHINSKDVDMAVYSVAFARDGRKIYGGNGDGTISEWDIETGKESRVWKAHAISAFRLVFSPDYRLLASLGDSIVKLWDTSNWREVRSMSMIRTAGLTDISSTVAFSHDGRLMASSNIGLDAKQNTYAYVQTIVWNVKSGAKLFTLEGHKFDIDGLIFSRDDRFLLTGSVDTTIKFWDMKTGQLTRTLTMPRGDALK